MVIKEYLSQIDNDVRLQRAREYAQISGTPIGYITPDGKLIDSDGKQIEKLPNMITVRIDG